MLLALLSRPSAVYHAIRTTKSFDLVKMQRANPAVRLDAVFLHESTLYFQK